MPPDFLHSLIEHSKGVVTSVRCLPRKSPELAAGGEREKRVKDFLAKHSYIEQEQ